MKINLYALNIILREPLFGIATPITAVISRMCLHDLVNLNVSLYDMIYLIAIGLTTGSSITIHIYTQTIHRTTQFTN
jgi:uncharacterized integral membrane protein